jgi:hypothetical protein
VTNVCAAGEQEVHDQPDGGDAQPRDPETGDEAAAAATSNTAAARQSRGRDPDSRVAAVTPTAA